MDNNKDEFYTFRGYTLLSKEENPLTASMEDYLEMIYRLSKENGYTRINDLAAALNVQPPSATKMVQKLTDLNFLQYEKYGIIKLTKTGEDLGCYLLKRHNILEDFLRIIGVTEGLLEETEKIEHNVSEHTMKHIMEFVSFMKENPAWQKLFINFCKQRQGNDPISNG